MHSVLLAAAVAYAVIAQGGFYPPQAMTLAALSAGAAITCRARLPRTVLAAFGVLAAGIAISMAVVPSGDARIAVSVLVIAASATWVGASHAQTGTFGSLMGVLLALGVVASVAGVVGAAWHLEPLALEAQGIWRAASTLTYANSLGAVLVPCLVAGAWRLSARDALVDRIATAIVVGGLIASMSRAAWVALAIGVVVAAVADGRTLARALAAVRLPVVGGAIIGVATLPAIMGEPAPVIAGVGFLLGIAVCVPDTRSRIATVATLSAAAVLAAGLAGIVATGRVEGLARRLVNEDRSQIWRASLDTGIERLPFGQGLGHFEVYEQRHQRVFRIQYAHNEGIQALVETGAVGPIIYSAATVLLGFSLLRRRRRHALVLVAATAFLAHGMLDFVWHVAAVPLLAFLFVGAGQLDASRPAPAPSPAPPAAPGTAPPSAPGDEPPLLS